MKNSKKSTEISITSPVQEYPFSVGHKSTGSNRRVGFAHPAGLRGEETQAVLVQMASQETHGVSRVQSGDIVFEAQNTLY